MKTTKMLTLSIYVALTSHIMIKLFVREFNISFAIILFSIYIYTFPNLNTIFFGIATAIAVYIGRIGIHVLDGTITMDTAYMFLPEAIFYMSFGVLYSILNKRIVVNNKNRLFFILVICDYIGNMIEILMRMKIDLIEKFFPVAGVLLVVAIIRSGIVWFVLSIIEYYRLFVLKKEHAERYRKLLWVTSRMKMEIYWMKKTSDNIEKVMSNAYSLFSKITEGKDEENWGDLAAKVAKDVHEIKKEHNLFLRGVEEILENKLKDRSMDLNEIMSILTKSMENEIIHRKQNIDFYYELGNNFNTSKHYYLMSIFRNLITNSMDAIGNKPGKIVFTHKEDEKYHIFIIKDTGCGMKSEDQKYIFHSGFSTKINYETGSINRGLGLSLVNDIVKEEFGGIINVESKEQEGSTFYIHIPQKAIEESRK